MRVGKEYYVSLGYPLGFVRTGENALFYVESAGLYGMGQMQLYFWLSARYGVLKSDMLDEKTDPARLAEYGSLLGEMVRQKLLVTFNAEDDETMLKALAPVKGLRQGEGRGAAEGGFVLRIGAEDKLVTPFEFEVWRQCTPGKTLGEVYDLMAKAEPKFGKDAMCNCVMSLLRAGLLYLEG